MRMTIKPCIKPRRLLWIIASIFIITITILPGSISVGGMMQGNENAYIQVPAIGSNPHGKILIAGNQALVDFPDKTGAGTPESPYVIENLEIDCGGTSTGIWIMNTDLSLVISNCTIWNSGTGTVDYGIRIEYSHHVTIENSHIRDNKKGILLYFTGDTKLLDNNVSNNNGNGIRIESSNNTLIARNHVDNNLGNGLWIEGNAQNNSIVQNHFGNNVAGNVIYAGTSEKNWFNVDGYGNYWSDYMTRYPSATNDGIVWNTPYSISTPLGIQDNYPIVNMEKFSSPIRFLKNEDIDAFPSKTGTGTEQEPFVISNLLIFAFGNSYGVHIFNTTYHVKFSGCKILGARYISGTDSGVLVEHASNIEMHDCEIILNIIGMRVEHSVNVTILECNVNHNNYKGIAAYNATSLHVLTTELNTNTECGISVDQSTNSTIEHNQIDENGKSGIAHTSSSNSIVHNNSISSNGACGLEITGGNNVTVQDNEIVQENSKGIVVDSSSGGFMRGNTITSYNSSIELVNSVNYSLENNTCTGGSIIVSGMTDTTTTHQINTTNTLNGHLIYYVVNSNLTGFDFSNPGQIIIVNCTSGNIQDIIIANASNGIIVLDSAYNSIKNVTFVNNYLVGIYMVRTTSTTITDSNFTVSEKHVSIEDGQHDNIINSTFTGAIFSIHLQSCAHTNVSGNNFSDCTCSINIIQTSNNVHLKSNIMNGTGINIDGNYVHTHSIDTTNLVNGYPIYYMLLQDGVVFDGTNIGQLILLGCNNAIVKNIAIENTYSAIVLYSSNNNTFENVRVKNCAFRGFQLAASSFNKILHTEVIDCGTGMGFFFGSNNNTVVSCNITGNNEGVYTFYNSQYSIIENNNITCNNVGISLYLNSYGTRITQNNVSFNDMSGVVLGDCDYGVITGNNVSFNGKYGVEISSTSSNNLIYRNSFIRNEVSESYSEDPTSQWNTTTVGNFWGDYEGRYPQATHGEFTWSTPYEINGTSGVFDHHPMYYNTVPVANFTVNATIILSSWSVEFAFSGSAGDWPQAFQWKIDNGSVMGLTSIIVWKFESVGQFNVTMSIIDRNGDADTCSILIMVLNATADDDDDGLSNEAEITIHSTHPLNPDTDEDMIPDGWEVNSGLDPLDESDAPLDQDNDGLTNIQEYQHDTDPFNYDTDGDGYSDGYEVMLGTNPADPQSTPTTIFLIISILIGTTVAIIMAITIKMRKTTKHPPLSTQAKTEMATTTSRAIRETSDEKSFEARLQEKRNLLERTMMPGQESGVVNTQVAQKKQKLKAGGDAEEVHHREIDHETEKELNVELKEERCIVCNKPLAATSYVCPTCKTKYCIRCAITLSEREEDCWACKTRLTFDT